MNSDSFKACFSTQSWCTRGACFQGLALQQIKGRFTFTTTTQKKSIFFVIPTLNRIGNWRLLGLLLAFDIQHLGNQQCWGKKAPSDAELSSPPSICGRAGRKCWPHHSTVNTAGINNNKSRNEKGNGVSGVRSAHFICTCVSKDRRNHWIKLNQSKPAN